MRPKSLLLLALALGCGLIASIGISQVMDRKDDSQTYETEEIYVAKHDINVGDEITAESVNLEAWPADKIHPDAIRELESVVGRRPATKLYKGDQVHEAKLIDVNAPSAPAFTIPPGMRVVNVKVDAVTGAAGLLRPGDRVDVQLFVTANPGAGIPKTETRTIMKDLQVFAVDQHINRRVEDTEGGNVARTIGLLVTPEQADKITLASNLGSLRLIMRHPDDKLVGEQGSATIDDLFKTSKGNRELAKGLGDALASQKSGFSSFLEQLREAAANAAVPTSAVHTSWKMDILEGSEVRRVEFADDGQLPQEVDGPTTEQPIQIPSPTTSAPLELPGGDFAPVPSELLLKD
jgi:pilus assembly protein CpaB